MAVYTTIDDPAAHFQVNLYTGDGNDNRDLVLPGDTDMQPDMIWTKNRDNTQGHAVVDAVRGGGETVYPDDNGGEDTHGLGLTVFNSDGYRVRTGAHWNTNTEKYVGWCWKANGTGSSNTTGSINTTATSANTTSGFSIITYTGNDTAGATIGHGLGAVPHFIMIKCRSASQSWPVYHHKNTSAPETDFLILDTAVATADASNRWNDTAPTSTLITLGDENQSNGALNYVAYAWTEIQGYSKFGVYKGNGNADGAFVYTGFKPAFLIIKLTSGAGQNWFMFDNKRSPFNINTKNLYADETGAEGTADRNDFLSNGFKIRESGAGENGSGSTYVYIAFAEAPFVNSEGVPGNAR